jgi:hypothetical protein
MAVTKEIKEKIASLSKEELVKIVLKSVSKDKLFMDYIQLTYFKNDINENDIFEEYKQKINKLIYKRYKGYAGEEKAAHFMTACNKELANFEKLSKNYELIVALILLVLEKASSDFDAGFGTCFTAFDYKFTLLLKKVIRIINTKMHEDMKIEYSQEINNYLKEIKENSAYLDYVYELPKEI